MRLKVKICGLTRPEQIRAALDAGVDAIGLVGEPDSPRYVADPAPLLSVADSVLCVAVFTHWTGQPLDGFDLVQAFTFDGEPPVPRLHAHRDAPELELERCPTPLGDALLDGPAGGGRGLAADRSRAHALARRCDLILAGGLTPDNVGPAIAAVRPAGVDVSSGVERAPGLKCPHLVHQFVRAARQAALELS